MKVDEDHYARGVRILLVMTFCISIITKKRLDKQKKKKSREMVFIWSFWVIPVKYKKFTVPESIIQWRIIYIICEQSIEKIFFSCLSSHFTKYFHKLCIYSGVEDQSKKLSNSPAIVWKQNTIT